MHLSQKNGSRGAFFLISSFLKGLTYSAVYECYNTPLAKNTTNKRNNYHVSESTQVPRRPRSASKCQDVLFGEIFVSVFLCVERGLMQPNQMETVHPQY